MKNSDVSEYILPPLCKVISIMLITFKSKAAADIVMYEIHAKPILDLLGKDIQRGIITAEECPQAIKRIEEKIAENTSQTKNTPETNEADPQDQAVLPTPVSMSARFYPLVEMLKAAEKKHCDVVWGV